jgi:hypothetical protein
MFVAKIAVALASHNANSRGYGARLKAGTTLRVVIASEAKQSTPVKEKGGLLRRSAPRNDDQSARFDAYYPPNPVPP